MRILWITNIPLPPICKHLHIPQPVVGGWLYSSLKELKVYTNSLAVATMWNKQQMITQDIDGIKFYMIPSNGKLYNENKKLETVWKNIDEDFKPDIIHLHGTEYAHGLPLLNVIPKEKIVVSIQGLTSSIASYYKAGISLKEEIRHTNLVNLYLGNTITQQQRMMKKRGYIENEILIKAKYIIGRTDWDFAHIKAVNENLEYFHCNESLRASFYNKMWQYDTCEKYSIFVSQSHYPLKGLHMLLKALPLIIKRFPETKVYIAGNKRQCYNTLRKKLSRSTYDKYIEQLIKDNNLDSHINYTGYLDEEQIVAQYLKSNLFVSLSSIENSPNSLAEAQLLGVPCVSSYVGGAPDFIEHSKSGFLYRFEETEMLAMYVCKIFDMNDTELKTLSSNSRKTAALRHCKETNKQTLLTIYNQIYKNNNEK